MLRDIIPSFGRRKAKVDPSPYFEKIEAIEGTNARATARRLVRAQRAAPIIRYPEVRLTKAEERELRQAVSNQRGIPMDEVDLDEVVIPSGLDRRRYRRQVERAEVRRRKKGQRAFNRMVRGGEMKTGTAEALARLQSADTPMGANIRSAIAQHEKVQAKSEGQAERRAVRRAVHEENRERRLAERAAETSA